MCDETDEVRSSRTASRSNKDNASGKIPRAKIEKKKKMEKKKVINNHIDKLYTLFWDFI